MIGAKIIDNDRKKSKRYLANMILRAAEEGP